MTQKSMDENDVEHALLQRIAQYGASQDDQRCKLEQGDAAPQDDEERHKKWLEDIANRDNTDDEEQSRHERFLKAKEEATKKGRITADGTDKSKVKPQVSIGIEKYDAPVGERLEALGAHDGSDERENHRHQQFLRAQAEARKADKLYQQHEVWVRDLVEQQKKETGSQLGQLQPNWISEQEHEKLGYPQFHDKFKDKNWHLKQMELDRTDPRHNPNLLRDSTDPEFWYHAARKPFNKAMLRTEQHWDMRRKTWMKQYEQVQELNNARAEVVEMLEDAANDIKRILAPIMQYTITTVVLTNMLDRARKQNKSLGSLVEEKDNRETLDRIRSKIDYGGEAAAEAMMCEYSAVWSNLAHKLYSARIESERAERKTADMHTLSHVMNWGLKCKKDGLIEWDGGNWAEAHASWYQADEALRKFKAHDRDESTNKMVYDLHGNILRNLAQACIKLEYWDDSLRYASEAIKLYPDDHKAWFRKACAYEGLGKIDEAEECLRKVDDCAIGRVDYARITKDTETRRGKLQALRERDQAAGKKMFEKALEQGVFSGERRHAALKDDGDDEDDRQKQAAVEPATLDPLDGVAVKHLTREGAEDLLVELREAYKDTLFQKQIEKLAMDVRRDKQDFLSNLTRVALPLQRPILEKWGFEPSERGVQEMKRAIKEFLSGPKAHSIVKQQADETTQVLFGSMYDILTLPDS